MRCTDWNDFNTLDDVKQSLSNFMYNEYVNKIHSSTNETPNERWHNEYSKVVFLDKDFIDESFLHRVVRKVRLDRTIKINNTYYEVPFKYVGKSIELRYNPFNTSQIFVFEDNKKLESVKIVDKVVNSKSKRKNSIDYSLAINDERDVIERND